MNYARHFACSFFILLAVSGCGSDDSPRQTTAQQPEQEGPKRSRTSKETPDREDATKDDAKEPRTSDESDDQLNHGKHGSEKTPDKWTDVSHFERLPLATALKVFQPNLNLIAKRTRYSYHQGQRFEHRHDWQVRIPILGLERATARTFFNDKLVDNIDLRLVPDRSNDNVKTYVYSDFGYLRGATYKVNMTLVHFRAKGRCEVRFYRYDNWSAKNTLGNDKGYIWKVACPKIVGSLKSDINYVNPNWKLRGSSTYSTFWGTSYPIVEMRVLDYEFVNPRIILISNSKLYAEMDFKIDPSNSSAHMRYYLYGPDSAGRRATFMKNTRTGDCQFFFIDSYFKNGIQLSGSCADWP